MKTLLLLALAAPPAAQPRCHALDRDTVALTGVVQRRTFPGPPNFESVAKGDRPESGLYLRLDRPLCTRAVPGEHAATSGIRDLQLVLDEANRARVAPRLGRRIVVTGTLFAAETGHHHTPVLLLATAPVR